MGVVMGGGVSIGMGMGMGMGGGGSRQEGCPVAFFSTSWWN